MNLVCVWGEGRGQVIGRGQQSLVTLAKYQRWKELDLASRSFHLLVKVRKLLYMEIRPAD